MKSRKSRFLSLATLAIAVSSLSAAGSAQGIAMPVLPTELSQSMLLSNPQVRSELKLTTAQNKEADRLSKQVQVAMQTPPDMQGATSKEEAEEMLQFHFDDMGMEFKALLGKLSFSKSQFKRLGQIDLQLAPADVLLRQDIIKTLKITKGQKDKIRQILDKSAEDFMANPPDFDSGSGGAVQVDAKHRDSMQKKMAETKKVCLKLLNAKQTKAWKTLIGSEFKLKAGEPSGRRGRVLASPSPGNSMKLEGKPLPEFEMTTIDGKKITSADLKGKVTVLDFWATWCSPCKLLSPTMQKLHEEFGSKAVRVIGASTSETGDAKALISAYASDHDYTYTMTYDNQAYADSLGVTGIPCVIVIDQKGIVQTVFVGYHDGLGKQIESVVTSLIAK